MIAKQIVENFLDDGQQGTPANKPGRSEINWTPEMLRKFKIAYKQALAKVGRNGTFMFDGNEFVVAYAGYLIQYLDSQFGSQSGPVNRN